MMIPRLLAALLAFGVFCFPATGSAAPPLELYGRLPGVEAAKLSPSGKRLAIIGVLNDERRLLITEGDTVVRTALLGTRKVRRLHWAGDDMVLLRIDNTASLGPEFTTNKAELSTMVVVTVGTGQAWSVFTGYDAVAGGVRGFYGVVEREGRWYGYFGGMTLGRSRLMETYFSSGQPELYEVDLAAHKHRLVGRRLPEPENPRDWVIGGGGEIRASLDFLSKSGKWSIKNARHATLAEGVAPTGDIQLVGLGRTPDTILYLVGNEERGRHLIETPLAGGAPTEILADLGLQSYFFDRRDFRLIGYVEDGDYLEAHFFSPRMEKIMAATRKAFPGVAVRLVDWNDAFDRLVVETSGTEEPDGWWIVDVKTGQASPIGVAYPMPPGDVGPISMIRYKAADGLEIAGVLTLPPGRPAQKLPLIMLPHGGPSARDYPEFDWWAQAFASRGYAVFQPNFRGSTGYGAGFERAGWGEWGHKMQSDISDGLDELVRQGIVDRKRVCIVGASYGGYAALAGVTLQQGLYRCAVSVAGISDLSKMLRDDIRQSGADPTLMRALKQEIGSGRDLKPVSPISFASRADAPILLVHGKDDVVVPFDQSTAMLSALKRADKPVEMITLDGEDHWLSKSETRLAMLKAAVGFVEKHNPPGAPPAR